MYKNHRAMNQHNQPKTCNSYIQLIKMSSQHPKYTDKPWHPYQHGTWKREHTRPPGATMYGSFHSFPLGPYWSSPLALNRNTYYGFCKNGHEGLLNYCNDSTGFYPLITRDGRCQCVNNSTGQAGCFDEPWSICATNASY